MEVTVTQENLSFAVSNVGRLATSKAGLPILNNILIRTDGNRLLIAATNLEVAATHYIGAKITKPGSITVPARLVSEFIQNLSKDKITLSVKNSRLHISSPNSSSTINGVSDEEFPELPSIDKKKSVTYTLTAADFKHAVSQTLIAASSDATRPILTGVYWHSFEGSLYVAATDGYRLAERKIIPTKSDVVAVIPTSTLQEVLRTLRDDTEEVEILFDDTQVTFRMSEIEITSRLIDGNFPDYRQLIPTKSDTEMTVNRTEFVRIIKIAGLFARDSGGGITLSVDSDKKELTIHSIASDIGENSSTLSIEVGGESGSVSVNSRYLLDALSAIDNASIQFKFSGKLAPCILQEVDTSASYKHIIMPLKS